MRSRIYLSSSHVGREKKYFRDAIETNWITRIDPNVDTFEDSLEAYCGINLVVSLSSGKAAIHLGLIQFGAKSGDEVITSSFTFSATINPIVYRGNPIIN